MTKVSISKLELGFKPTANYPRPALVQEGARAFLYFTARRNDGKEEVRVVAVMSGCLASHLGYPNDEALAGHPLYQHGLGYYGIFEVHGSPWMDAVKSQNKVSFPKFEMPDRRHIIVTMHDDTFECLTKTFEIHPASEFPPDRAVSTFWAID